MLNLRGKNQTENRKRNNGDVNETDVDGDVPEGIQVRKIHLRGGVVEKRQSGLVVELDTIARKLYKTFSK